MSAASRETVLVTGASSGIGRELARLFAQDGCRLILAARRQDKLEELAAELHQLGVETLIVPVDLGAPQGPARLMEQVAQAGWQVDVLINNAGFAQLGRFAELPLERQLGMVKVNITALTELTHRVLPEMLARRRGVVLNIGSTAAFQPGPNCAVYYATKAYVLSFSEALWAECRSRGVHVGCLCPGPTITGFGEDSGMGQTPIFRWNSMPVTTVARVGHRMVRRRQRLVVPGVWNWLLAASVRFSARPVVLWLMQWLQPAH
jgi:short-subunit dehydrogenase